MSEPTKFFLCSNDLVSAIVESADYPKMLSEGGPWTSSTCGYSSEQELRKEAQVHPSPCVKCGRMFTTRYIEPTRSEMIASGICFSCHFWIGYIKSGDKDPRIARINGRHFYANPKTSDNRWNGCGGRVFTIRWKDGREETTNDLWVQGDIPAHFRDELPDNAEFIETPKPTEHGQGFLGKVNA